MTHWARLSAALPQRESPNRGKGSSTARRPHRAPRSWADVTRDEGTEIDQFEKKFGYKPLAIRTSVDALAVFVNKDNPISASA